MIRLTLNAQSDPEIHLFNKSTILIGSDSGHVDLVLSHQGVHPVHLKIINQDEFRVLVNHANDPFVSVNGHAFGKKKLNSGDVIFIHHISLLFEELTPSLAIENEKEKERPLAALLENNLNQSESALPSVDPTPEKELLASFSFPFEQEVTLLGEEELRQSAIDKFLKEIENSPQTTLNSPPKSSEKQELIERKKTASLKDDYLRDLDDENNNNENGPFGNLKEPSHLYHAWKWILLFIFSLFSISGAVGTIIYFSASDKAEAQETKAAQGVSDVAMALAHAQINHLKPHNQNWSDLDFLKNNLQSILPDVSSYASQIDAQGQFICCPYSLRIYTNSDLSHFLLIAQPAPNLLNWLIPQSLITVDSQLMELRILKDVRNLNRLLANSDPLEGPSGKEITSLIKQGQLIHLSTLAHDSGLEDFSPPKNLAWIKPGAENLIYNAPRYYRLGHPILQKAMALSTSKGTSQEVATLKQSVEHLSWLSDFILYSDQGKQSAMLARQGLMLFAPSDNLLFGYLQFNTQGKIHQVQLLKEEEESIESIFAEHNQEDSLIAFQSDVNPIKEDLHKKNAGISEIDANHPIYIQLLSLKNLRDNELKSLANSLINLVNLDLSTPRAKFQMEFQNLSHAYLMANAKHKQIIKSSLDNLYQQYEDLPIDQFLAFVKALNLEYMIQQEDQALSTIDENCKQNMELLLTYIENSKTFAELDNLVHIASTWLNFDYIKDPNELMKYQNRLRNQVLIQLEKGLISHKKQFNCKTEDKEFLLNILSQERLIKAEEKEYFLEEFDEIIRNCLKTSIE